MEFEKFAIALPDDTVFTTDVDITPDGMSKKYQAGSYWTNWAEFTLNAPHVQVIRS